MRTPLIPALRHRRAKARLTESGYQHSEPSISLLNTKARRSSSCSHSRARSTARARWAVMAATVVGSRDTRRAAWVLVSYSTSPSSPRTIPREIHTDALARSRSGHRRAISSLRRAPVAAASRM